MKRKIKISELLKVIPYSYFEGNTEIEVLGITCNSKEVENGFLFVAIKGFKEDGRNYINEAIKKGASAILSFDKPFEKIDVPVIVSEDERKAFSIASSYIYPQPDSLKVLGITGTNGKTTIVYLLREIFNAYKKGAILSTIEYDDGEKLIEATRTTPEAHFIHKWLNSLPEKGVEYAAMEVSSHSLELKRVFSVRFDGVGFTNLTRDHLDFHKTMENYFNAKKKIFELLNDDGFSVINLEDQYSSRILNEIDLKRVYKIGLNSADIYPEKYEISLSGIKADLISPAGKLTIDSPLIGIYNLLNILFGVAFSFGIGIDKKAIEEGIKHFKGAPGRLERVDMGQDFYVFVDYAHSDDALKNLLLNIKPLVKGRVITVFGCGGDRDKTKRPLMGAVATKLSDIVILTTDNSRSEEPEEIAREVEAGILSELNISKNYLKVLDRKEAIKKAFEMAQKDDVVVIAGKGHERTQNIKGNIFPFHDPTVAKEILKEMG